MCGTYGFDEMWIEPRDSDSEAPAGRRRPSFTAVDDAAHADRLGQWAEARGGIAQLTRRKAHNLNPIVHEPGGERRVELAWWWLWLNGAPAPFSAFNSRDDALMRSWRVPFQQRAILPATWYREQGFRFDLGGEPFGIAAITSTVPQENGADLMTYSMVTRSGVGAAASVLSSRGEARMPLILPEPLHDEWLARGRIGDRSLVERAVSASEELCRAIVRSDPEPAGKSERGRLAAPTLFDL